MTQQLTPNFALPYYQGSDPADGATQQQALAVKLDTVLKPFAPVTVSTLVGDVGQTTQARAGRQLALSDFTNLGLNAPQGLWNLSNLTDASGNGRNLSNKGAVGFGLGINGVAATAAQFTGSTAQALYIADTGAADPFRISTGSWGCWFRTAKRGASQRLLSKDGGQANGNGWGIDISGSNLAEAYYKDAAYTTTYATAGVSDVVDDRWHFGVCTADGTTLRLYVDGILEATVSAPAPMYGSVAALNIGGNGADASAITGNPAYGRVDEAFVTADVLTEDQVRFLYAARLVHTLGAQPKTVSLSVRRQRRGAALATTDFSATPLRLYNLTDQPGGGGPWNVDQGSNNVVLTWNSGLAGPGADGKPFVGYSFNGSGGALSATDAGLPSALTARSYGCWFKTSSSAASATAMIAWGTTNTADVRLMTYNGGLLWANGADQPAFGYVADGQWHHVVATEDNTITDGTKRKLYLDGRLYFVSAAMNSITLAGANRFRVGANPDGTAPFTGQIDGVFVTGYAMTTDEVLRLYAKASQTMPSSPKNSGDHVEGYDSGSVLVVADTLDAQHYIDLTLA
jgi:hypothetical protein